MSRMSGELRRPQIAAAALKIIAERGPAGFTTRALAKEVGLAEGTIFRHFGSKEEIVTAALDLLERRFTEELDACRGDDPVESLGRFLRRRLALVSQNPGVARILFSEELAQAGSEEATARIRRIKRASQHFVASRVLDARRAGRLRFGVEPDVAAALVHGAALAVLFGATGPESPLRQLTPEALWEGLRAALFTGEAPPSGDIGMAPARGRR